MTDIREYRKQAARRNKRNNDIATMLKIIFVVLIVIVLIWFQVGLWSACLDGNIGACLLAR